MKVARKFERSSARRARLGAYLATGVSAIGLGTSADAGVISIDLTGYTGDNLGLASGGFNFFNFIPGSTLFAANAYNGYTGLSVQGITGAGIAATTGNGTADTPIKFGPGSVIGPSSGTFESGYSTTVFKSPARTVGDFEANSYIGFRTDQINGVNYYGYIEVLWTASTNTFKLVSAAYDDTGAPIQTPGGSGAVPEPASGAIAALLMGGTALRQWRKKRHQESNEAVAS